MQEEMNSIKNNDTWELVELPQGKKVVGSKWFIKLSTMLMEPLIGISKGL